MARIRVLEDFGVGARAVWRVLSDFGGLAEWKPGTDSCEMEGRGVGAIRTMAIGPMRVRERIDAFDPDTRTLSYSMVEGPLADHRFVARIEVAETGSESCRVDWSADFDRPEEASEGQIESALEKNYANALRALRSLLEP